MNLSNRLTCVRVALVLVFMIFLLAPGLLSKALALLVFSAAVGTDYWDGKIARARREETHFGKLMDPIADKLLVLAAFIGFVQINLVPAWMVVLVVMRDLLITGMRFSMPAGPSQGARWSGKLKTAFQFVLIVGVLLFLVARETRFWRPEWESPALDFIHAGMFLIVAMTLWSGILYVIKNRQDAAH